MKRKDILTILILSSGLLVCLPKVGNSETMGTAFTYQGRLIDVNDAADGLYDFQFKLFDSAEDGTQLNGDVNMPDLDVIDGYFTVEVDFGSGIFDGNSVWLDIGIRPGEINDPNLYTALSPRQLITPTPYALYAKTAGSGGGADSDWMVSGNDMYSIPTGNIGIGTTNPLTKLHLDSEGNTEFRIEHDDVKNTISFYRDTHKKGYLEKDDDGGIFKMSADGINDHITIEESTGNVGIGTTSPSSKLHIEDDTEGSLALTIHNLDNSGSERILFGTGSGSDAGIIVWGSTNATNPGKWRFFNNKTSGHYDWITNGSVRMTLTSVGSLGIGTDAPAEKLHVAGDIRLNAGGDIAFADDNTRIHESSDDLYLEADDDIYISPDDDIRMDVDTLFVDGSTNRVGIGTTSPAEKLTVRGGNLLIERSDGTDIVELGEGLDYAEGFDVSDKSKIASGSVLIIDSENPGKLALSNKPYDIKVAGIVAGAKGMGSGVRLGAEQFDYDVALAGRVYCNVDATEAAVQPGDLLTTSATCGYAMKAANYTRAQGAILGKAMEKLEKGKKGQILVLVTLQ